MGRRKLKPVKQRDRFFSQSPVYRYVFNNGRPPGAKVHFKAEAAVAIPFLV